MAFRKLTQQQLEMLSAEDRKIYEQAYEEYLERERFVEKLEQLENVKMPEVQIKRRPIRRVSSPGLRPVKMQQFVADTKGVDLLNATNNAKRAAANPVSINPDEKFTVKTPTVNTRTPGKVNVNLAPEYKVGGINKVSVDSPSVAKFESTDYKVDVPEQKDRKEPEIRTIAIEDYAVKDMDSALSAASVPVPAVPASKIARNEEPQYQVNVVRPAEADVPGAPKVMIEDFAVSDIPNASVDASAAGDVLNVAASVNAEPQFAVNVSPIANIAGPETKAVKIDNYAIAGLPEAFAEVSADTSVSNVADKLAADYKVDVASPAGVDAPSVQNINIAPLEKINVSPVTLAEPDIVKPVVADYKVQGYTPAAANVPSVSFSQMKPVSVEPIALNLPEAADNAPSAEFRDFEVSVTAPAAITVPDVKVKNTASVKAEVPNPVHIPEIPAGSVSSLPKMNPEPVKINVSVPEVKIPTVDIPNKLKVREAEPQSEKTSMYAVEFAVPDGISFNAPNLQVTHTSVPAIESPVIDSETALKNILATIR
ncbi:MAG: hypothetical protein J5643_11630 [Lachnospiraceae bacterium]|nr:hypothetical protein [Lachnospiraceae bacterium]